MTITEHTLYRVAQFEIVGDYLLAFGSTMTLNKRLTLNRCCTDLCLGPCAILSSLTGWSSSSMRAVYSGLPAPTLTLKHCMIGRNIWTRF